MSRRILLLSDNHGYYHDDLLKYADGADEVWHAGDIGNLESVTPFKTGRIFRGVFGNIDGGIIRETFPEDLLFECEGVRVFMTHIGGYPGRYVKRVYEILKREKPHLYISGHSHICKVMFDRKLQLLHMNPGAYGIQGWHQKRTLIRFTCAQGEITNAEVVELGDRSSAP